MKNIFKPLFMVLLFSIVMMGCGEDNAEEKMEMALMVYEEFVSKYPSHMKLIPEPFLSKIKLRAAGPPGMKISDISNFLKEGVSEAIMIPKIKQVDGTYKNFAFDEIKLIKELGISDNLIAAMIEKTGDYEKQKKEIRQQAVVASAESKPGSMGKFKKFDEVAWQVSFSTNAFGSDICKYEVRGHVVDGGGGSYEVKVNSQKRLTWLIAGPPPYQNGQTVIVREGLLSKNK